MILRLGEFLGIPAGVPDVAATVAALRWGLWLVAALWAVMVARRGRRAWLLGGHPLVALKAVAHKLARACYHMLREQVPFDVSRAFS